MKKLLIAFLTFALLLAGCGTSLGGNETTEPLENSAANTPNTEAVELQTKPADQEVNAALPMITVSVPIYSEDVTAEDGTVIFRTITQNMRLVMQDPDVADRIIVDFLNRIDHVTSTHNEMVNLC